MASNGVNSVNSEAQAVLIARLQEQNATLFELAKQFRDDVRLIRETFEKGCVFGRMLKEDVDELKGDICGPDGIQARVTNLEHTRLTWSSKWGGVVVTLLVLGNVIAWGLMVYEKATK